MANFYIRYPSASGASNPSVGPTGSTAPTSATEVGFIDGSGNLQPFSGTNAASGPNVTVVGSTLPAGSATSANQVLEIAQLTAINGNTTGVSTAALQTSGNSSLSTIATNTTGVATAANQTTANTSLATIATNTTGVSTAANQSSVIGTKAAGTAATNSLLAGGVYNSSAPTLTTGQQAALQVDSSGNLMVNMAAPSTDRIATATLGALNAAVTVNTQGCSSAGFYVTSGLAGGTAAFEGTYDGISWFSILAVLLANGTVVQSLTPSSGAEANIPGVGPYQQIRVRISVYAGGSATATLVASTGIGPVQVISQAASTLPVNAAQSGTWNIANISGTVSLPTGASTAAKQPALGTAGTPSVDVISVQGVTGGKAFPMLAPVNSNGSFSQITNLTTAAQTFTVPANAVGFLLEAFNDNTVNIRWAIGSTATTTSGMRLEPGRDSGYIPCAANISVITESGSSQSISVQWILSS